MKIENLDLYSLKYFLDSVEAKSLTKAAELNFVTRSAISQSILRLEEWAGQRLTTHEKKIFKLTLEGESFYRQMKSAYENFQKTMSSGPENSQSLRIGCSASLVEALLLPALKKLGNKNSFYLASGTSRQLLYRLDQRDLNLILFVGDADSEQDNTQVLRSGHFVLASKTGTMSSQIVTTETRSEVTTLRKVLLKKNEMKASFQVVESWSLAAKIAMQFGYSCLVPDFLLGSRLKRIELRGFKPEYQIILKSLPNEKLTSSECKLIQELSR